ncbi:hypothetical protein Salat_1122200 [Sesamum alatum]|uniref:Uncharacterized protein n=1 Tax=Sesamum alatum TaxID=300844 RepID=A0AAE2CN29_9LAMI|nr:hypothetical protein Salat_1122200 [Sesamum alatum]
MPRCTRASSSREPSSPAPNEISLNSFASISSIPSKMSAKSTIKITKTVDLPGGYDVLTPVEYQRANNLPQVASVFRPANVYSWGMPFSLFSMPGLVFIHEKPSSYGTMKTRFSHVRKDNWEVSLAWHPSLNELPPINFKAVMERVRGVGLLEHGFKANELLEENLLIVAGLYPVEDT